MSDNYNNELWMSHFSCASWSNPDRWIKYFGQVQEILGAEITHLDEDDPIRRKWTNLTDAGEFVTRFGPGEDSRTIFGEMRSIDVSFTIWYFREDPDRDGMISLHGPPDFFADPERIEEIHKLFDCANDSLDSFYSYADSRGHQKKKKKNGAVNFEKELGGVFWLTYFNAKYASFFGEERIRDLSQFGIDVQFDRGVNLRLANTPDKVPDDLRRRAEIHLGEKSFVNPDPKDFTVKQPGQYALTFDQLRS